MIDDPFLKADYHYRRAMSQCDRTGDAIDWVESGKSVLSLFGSIVLAAVALASVIGIILMVSA